jgi:hypothetical protein
MGSKCPVCGKMPLKMVFGAGWAQDGYRCCGHTTDTILQWNQYAAAMELAKMEHALEHCEPQHEHEYQFHVTVAREHLIKVFGDQS